MNRKYVANNHENSNNKGWKIESLLANHPELLADKIDGFVGVVEDGRPEKTDLFITVKDEKGVKHIKRTEVKTLTQTDPTATSHAQYNAGNGFPLKKGISLTKQLQNYLCKADIYITAIMYEDDITDVNVLTRKQALAYYLPRLSYQCVNKKDRIRLVHGGAMKEKNIAQRLATLADHGYYL